uniref:sodium/nucleoside cotransporter 1-like n=1 Tax=Styela clava TaxID=7725 RepID=UPI001939FB19|nr:sodium/nucleoside cotransporter 1-like [Styela clava]
MTSFSSFKEPDIGVESGIDGHYNPTFEGDETTGKHKKKNGYGGNTNEKSSHYEDVDSISSERQAEGEKDRQERCDNDGIGEELEYEENKAVKCIVTPLQHIGRFLTKHQAIVEKIVTIVLVLFYIGYMIAALIRDFDRAIALLVIFCLVLFFQIYAFIRDRWGSNVWEVWKPVYFSITNNMYWIKWVCILILLGLLATWIALDTSKRPQQLISMAGYIVFVFCLFLASKYPARVRWRPVFWGLGIQIVLGMFILRTQAGFDTFNWLGYIAQTFLDFVDAGSIFVFGDLYYQHYFAFKVLPIVIYFSSFISILYYLGAMQWLIYKIAWLMQFSLGTSATESMCAAGNIFVGQTESPLLIRPYIKDVTTSELFAIMTAGFGTIAGSVLGAYLGFGIQAVYVITACVMAAPCALAIGKLMYPETKKSKFATLAGLELDPPEQRNIVEAAFVGASSALPLVLNIAANLIAFISLLAAINGGLSWYGGLMDYPQLSFELICSYVFLPITFLMGIEWQDCFKCAELLGTKIFLNEFIAYEELARLIDNKNNGTFPRENDDETVNWISDRSEAIITYALCGFANVGSLGIMLGGLGSMCPERQSEMAKIVIKALIAGIFVSILNACVAGFLYLPPQPNCTTILSYDCWYCTEEKNVYLCCEDSVGIDLSTTDSERCCDYDWSNGFNDLQCTNETLLF